MGGKWLVALTRYLANPHSKKMALSSATLLSPACGPVRVGEMMRLCGMTRHVH